MTVTQAGTGTSGPRLARISGVASTPDLRTGSITMAMRVKWGVSTTNTDHLLCFARVQANGRGIFLQRRSGDAGTVVIAYRYSGSSFSTVANATGAYGSTTAWVHIGVTYDGTTIRTYVDGVASGTAASASTFLAAGAADELSCGGPFTGDMADCVMFDTALNDAQMAQLAAMRVPSVAQGNCFLWVPMVDSTSLTTEGLDYSGDGNNCTLQSSGANNPAASNVSVPEVWNRRAPVIMLRAQPVAIDGSGNVSVSGSAAISEAAAITGTGQSSVSATATVSVATALTGAGQTSVSASATGKEAAALSGTGASSVSGSAAVSEAVALVGSGQVSVSATATVSVAGSGALDGPGNVSVSGAAAVSSLAAVTGAGNVSVAGSAAISQIRTIDGTGATSVSGSGTVSRQLQLVGSGDCAVAGSAAVSVAYALTGTGQVSVSGAGSFDTPSGGSTGDDQPTDRRWLAALGSRRKVRR